MIIWMLTPRPEALLMVYALSCLGGPNKGNTPMNSHGAGPPELIFLFSQVESVLQQLINSVHAQCTCRLLNGLCSSDQLLCCTDQGSEYHQKKKVVQVKSLKRRNSTKTWSAVKQNGFAGTCAGAPFVYSVSVSITIDKTDSTKLEVVNLSNSKSCTFRVSNYSNHIASLFSVLEALAAKKKRFFFLKAFENTENYNMKQSLKKTKTTPI